MLKKINKIYPFVLMVIILMLPYFVFAADPLKNLQDTAIAGGFLASTDEDSMVSLIGEVVNIFLSLLGVIFVILILYAGYHWMTARGDEPKVEKAKDTLWRAIIGLIIIVSAYAIETFLLAS